MNEMVANFTWWWAQTAKKKRISWLIMVFVRGAKIKNVRVCERNKWRLLSSHRIYTFVCIYEKKTTIKFSLNYVLIWRLAVNTVETKRNELGFYIFQNCHSPQRNWRLFYFVCVVNLRKRYHLPEWLWHSSYEHQPSLRRYIECQCG